ncbi:uncharacterized protein LOC132757228 isoform X2 [Ruditapes philippinarum]|uniref:uncharacterized protein LOC132757228 isoform X2 n=1 Tax=Ruditapes philippinarum TaxID=129788 RepID=UPI00295AC76C|nr:uncharacterized protein LOC132757228 isoform X2 [Ruditapes philippinarum]
MINLNYLYFTVSGNYVLSNQKFTWHGAKSRGNFATPNINIMSSLVTVDNLNNLKNEEAWVGYYSKETAFAYIGCLLIKNENPKALFSRANNNPGICFSVCKKYNQNYIGLNGGKCFCMQERPSKNINRPACDISPDGIFVKGGVHKADDYMSIYVRIKTDINVTNHNGQIGGKCLSFERKSTIEYQWSACINSYQFLCTKNSNQHAEFQNLPLSAWRHYVKTCFEHNCLPITYNDKLSSTVDENVGLSWTNVIRSDVIYKYHGEKLQM